MPPERNCASERFTAEIGTAKPTPSLAPELVSICWLIPTTRPAPSSSGPPELPGLIEASVWIAPSIWNWVRDLTERSVAEITPTERDCCSPKGLPIAATGWPTTRSLSLPSPSGRIFNPSGLTLSRATSAKGSNPSTSAGTTLRSGNSTKTWSATLRSPPLPSVTTWALVTISPSLLRTNPEPSAALGPAESTPEPLPKIERIVTTPGESSRNTLAASNPESAVCTTTCLVVVGPPPELTLTVVVSPPEPPQPASSAADSSSARAPVASPARSLMPPGAPPRVAPLTRGPRSPGRPRRPGPRTVAGRA